MRSNAVLEIAHYLALLAEVYDTFKLLDNAGLTVKYPAARLLDDHDVKLVEPLAKEDGPRDLKLIYELLFFQIQHLEHTLRPDHNHVPKDRIYQHIYNVLVQLER